MGRTAESKLEYADRLDKKAASLAKRDPESSGQLKDLARAQRRRAIKQMRRRPKHKTTMSRLGR